MHGHFVFDVALDPRWIMMIWRFAAPQNYKPNAAKNQPGLALVPGHILCCNEHTITATPPPRA